MAYETGTASSPTDLFTKLKTFLTTNTDLVADSQAWEIVWDAPDVAPENATDVVLRGPGLAGQDQVYIGMRLYQNIPLDSYYIETVGMTGILPAGLTYKDHVNVMPSHVRTFLDAGTMTYWFVANGRRFVAIVKISTVYEAMYAGLFMPYATPLAYPYPLFIGGSAGKEGYGFVSTSWRDANDNHTHFMFSHYNGLTGSGSSDSCAFMLGPDAGWRRVANTGVVGLPEVQMGPENLGDDWFINYDSANGFGTAKVMSRLIEAYGGDRLLWPHSLVQMKPTDQIYGILDGCYRCQGVANAAENLITFDGIDHIVIQDVYRTDFNSFWALALG